MLKMNVSAHWGIIDMKYQLVIFDLDGTILNTLEDLTDSVNFALRRCGFPEHSIENVRTFVGNGIRKLIERAVPKGTEEQMINKVHEEFTAYYKEHCADKTRPYDGIVEVLQNLKRMGVKLAVVSNKADYGVQELCRQYYDGIFDYAVGERVGIKKKPAPDSVNEVLAQLHIDRKNAVYVGDSDVDIETADNAQMDCIVVEWGFREKQFLIEKGAKVFASEPKQIEEIVTKGVIERDVLQSK